MTGPKRGDKITYVQPSGRIWYGTVTSRKGGTFVFHPAFGSTERYSATDAQENGVWMRGTLRWWWPPHRRARKALVSAYALGSEKVTPVGFEVNFEEALAAATRALNQDIRKLTGDMRRLSDMGARRRFHR